MLPAAARRGPVALRGERLAPREGLGHVQQLAARGQARHAAEERLPVAQRGAARAQGEVGLEQLHGVAALAAALSDGLPQRFSQRVDWTRAAAEVISSSTSR